MLRIEPDNEKSVVKQYAMNAAVEIAGNLKLPSLILPKLRVEACEPFWFARL